jgi:predicted TIM-barrel fold metal-dependent hydrolase
MFVMVCCSHGTRALDRHSGVRLAAYLSEQVSCPIVMSHAGGARILDAMLVAAAAPNLYLDTSYSLPYYLGSSVEGDFAFAMRKLGTGRWVYGSDAPFDDLTRSLQVTLEFLDHHGFRAREIEDVLYGTAAGILGRASC